MCFLSYCKLFLGTLALAVDVKIDFIQAERTEPILVSDNCEFSILVQGLKLAT